MLSRLPVNSSKGRTAHEDPLPFPHLEFSQRFQSDEGFPKQRASQCQQIRQFPLRGEFFSGVQASGTDELTDPKDGFHPLGVHDRSSFPPVLSRSSGIWFEIC
jgi:hypothetical protein